MSDVYSLLLLSPEINRENRVPSFIRNNVDAIFLLGMLRRTAHILRAKVKELTRPIGVTVNW